MTVPYQRLVIKPRILPFQDLAVQLAQVHEAPDGHVQADRALMLIKGDDPADKICHIILYLQVHGIRQGDDLQIGKIVIFASVYRILQLQGILLVLFFSEDRTEQPILDLRFDLIPDPL